MRTGWQDLITRGIEILIGLVFLTAGGLKAYEPLDFIRQIGDYGIVTQPQLVRLIAWVMILVEVGLGTAMVVGFRRRISVPLAMLMLIGFIVMLGWAWQSGATEDCGCFGSWVKRTPAEAFTEDLLMLGATSLAWWLRRHHIEVETGRWRAAAVALSLLIGISVTTFASNSARQSSDPIERMKAQASPPNILEGVTVEGIDSDLRTGTRVLALIDTGCNHCQESVPELNRLAGELRPREIPLVALCSNKADEVALFIDKFNASFPLGRITPEQFTRLFERGKPPRLLLIHDGLLRRIWDGTVPHASEIR